MIALAVAWIATARMGNADGHRPALGRPAAEPTLPLRATSANAGRLRLERLLPADAVCEGGTPVGDALCSVAGVDVEYRLMRPDALREAYLAALVPGLNGGSTSLGNGSGPAACARGNEDERAWSRPAMPRRSVGRYACRIERSRAAMWWTVDDRGLLAHAIGPGADLMSLFAWWESHSER